MVSIAFSERGSVALARRLGEFDELVAANLLEAELHSAFARERVDARTDLTEALSWVIPDRPLHDEIARVLAAGFVRGADCWHLATALYLAQKPSEMTFLTLDDRQGAVARALGFRA